MPQILGALAIVALILTVVAWARILRRLGYEPLLALLVFVPFTEVLLLLWVAFRKWPVERRLDSLTVDLKRLRGEL